MNQGILDIANFKTCLFKIKLGLDFEDINRVARYTEKDKNFMVDYVKFIKRIKTASQKNDYSSNESLSFLFSSLKDFMKKSNLTTKDVIRGLFENKPKTSKITETFTANHLKVAVFARLFYLQIPHRKKPEFPIFLEMVKKMDIDEDGLIDQYDIETFFKRYEYLESGENEEKDKFSGKQTVNSALKTVTGFFGKTQSLFPKLPVTEEKFDEVIGAFKRVVLSRKLTFFEAFQMMDTNEDGFLTINEFLEGMDKFIKLSKTIKEGLFAYFDSLKIGLVDFPQFLAGLKKLPNSKKVFHISS